MRRAKAAYSVFSVTARQRFGVKASLTVFTSLLGSACPWLVLVVMASPGLVASHLVGFTR